MAPPVQEVATPSDHMSAFAETQYKAKYAMKFEDGTVEQWPDTARRVAENVMGALGYHPHSPATQQIRTLIEQRKFMPGGRYLYASGRDFHQVQNCALYRAEDSREGWAEVAQKAIMSLMTGAGIGVVYSDIRPAGSVIGRTGGEATGPVSLMQMVNENGRHIMQGGNRRSAIWAGLHWNHPDVELMIKLKDWDEDTVAKKSVDFNHPAPLDMTNISIILDDRFFKAYENEGHPDHALAHHVYWLSTEHMLRTAEPGFSVDIGEHEGENLRNACTEVTSRDDSDICNLGSLNLSRFDTREEFAEAVDLATLFLLAGTEYSLVPHEEIRETREKNRRLGLGIMGVHEWLLKRGYSYEENDELASWLDDYQEESDNAAHKYATAHGLSVPIAKRAIAPTGTIGIVAETTTGIEPIFCVAYKRRYKTAQTDGQDVTQYQYVIDPTAKRLIDQGVAPEAIEDAYVLSYNVEKRIAFQAWVQQWVDQGISSTVNLPNTITDPDEVREFGTMLLKHLPKLRGITCYPDGSRGGQPLTASTYEAAMGKEGVVFEENEETCKGGVCGS